MSILDLFRLDGQVAVVTGGASGIGAAVADAYREVGAVVEVADLQGREPVDVTDERQVDAFFERVARRHGRLDILVNNAGINIRKVIEEISAEELDQMYNVNVKGPFLGIKYALPVMKKIGGGSIINMSSVCGLIGHMYTPEAYTTTKGAVSLLTRAVASRYGKFNIRCNSINPSTADTPLVREMLKDPERKKERLGEVPLGRMASMQDIAEAALYLASDEGSFINGIALPVDGGVTAY
jgi:NAD(P)-dependent dehydrogenase (short-subunit alcohol dehydrogenase family)